jgi:hypothetical protein
MKAAYCIGTIAALAFLNPAAAFSDPLKLRVRMAAQEAKLKKDASNTNKVCGSALTVKFDWAGLREKDFVKYSVEGYCDAALEGIRLVCGDPAGKEAVREKIKTVICGFGPSRKITLKDGAVSYRINFTSSNDAAFVYEALENAL